MKFEISKHIAIQVRDYPKAINFYENVMGMIIKNRGKSESDVQCGDIIFHIEDSEKQMTFFDFKVDDLEAAKTRLKKAGCTFRETSCDQGKSYLVSDPYGMSFHLFQEKIQ